MFFCNLESFELRQIFPNDAIILPLGTFYLNEELLNIILFPLMFSLLTS